MGAAPRQVKKNIKNLVHSVDKFSGPVQETVMDKQLINRVPNE
jgi:hypothetical protein